MAQNDVLKRYIDTGLAFTALTQARAEALVKDLVKAGEVQADQARDAVADLVERSRKNSERLLETVRREVKDQITNLGLVSKADLDKAEQRISNLLGAAAGPVRKAAESGSKAATKAAGQASSAAKKATGSAQKPTATKAAAPKAPAPKAAAPQKAPAKKAPAKKAPAKKA
jgi:polyhydroxyalkanoate synthesis regulator phasin